jgi:hypothetical protein
MVTCPYGCPERHRGGVHRACLLDHINTWARGKGLAPIDDEVLGKLRRIDLVTGPEQHGHGRGHGSTTLWPALAYRQATRLLRIWHLNWESSRDLRLCAWLSCGAPVPLERIRPDLHRAVQLIVRRINRQARTDNISPLPGRVIERKVYQRFVAQMLDPNDPRSLIQRFQGAPDSALRRSRALLQHPAMAQLLRALVNLMFDKEPRGVIHEVEAVADETGRTELLGVEEGRWVSVTAIAGVLASEDEGNPLLEALYRATDAQLLAARTIVRDGPAVLEQVMRESIEIARARLNKLDVDDQTFDLAADLLQGFATFTRPRTVGDSFTAFLMLLQLSNRLRGFNVEALAAALEVCPRSGPILPTLAQHLGVEWPDDWPTSFPDSLSA